MHTKIIESQYFLLVLLLLALLFQPYLTEHFRPYHSHALIPSHKEQLSPKIDEGSTYLNDAMICTNKSYKNNKKIIPSLIYV